MRKDKLDKQPVDIIKVVFIGGTQRAYETFCEFITWPEIKVVYAIFMPGYENEVFFARKLSDKAKSKNVPHIVSGEITPEIEANVISSEPDVIIGGGIWRSMLSESFLGLAPYGYIGLHGTALPEYRGFAGINWQIINGQKELKMRMFQLGAGVDDGPLVADEKGELLEYRIDIDNEKHLDEILNEYQALHLKSYKELFQLILHGRVMFVAQDESIATYACHRSPLDSEIDWSQNTKSIFNLIRSQSKPYGGAFTYYKQKKIVINRARMRPEFVNYVGRIPGKVIVREEESGSVCVLTRDSAIEICEAYTNNEKLQTPFQIFDSVREKCQTKVELAADLIINKFIPE